MTDRFDEILGMREEVLAEILGMREEDRDDLLSYVDAVDWLIAEVTRLRLEVETSRATIDHLLTTSIRPDLHYRVVRERDKAQALLRLAVGGFGE